jgi:hypothetical protein
LSDKKARRAVAKLWQLLFRGVSRPAKPNPDNLWSGHYTAHFRKSSIATKIICAPNNSATKKHSKLRSQCPLWVINGHRGVSGQIRRRPTERYRYATIDATEAALNTAPRSFL